MRNHSESAEKKDLKQESNQAHLFPLEIGAMEVFEIFA